MDSSIIKGGLEAMQALADWYRKIILQPVSFRSEEGLLGDFSPSVVPMLRQDVGIDVQRWSWYAQISESRPSYGGYSGAPPTEKISGIS